jgi:hypothetical protein
MPLASQYRISTPLLEQEEGTYDERSWNQRKRRVRAKIVEERGSQVGVSSSGSLA